MTHTIARLNETLKCIDTSTHDTAHKKSRIVMQMIRALIVFCEYALPRSPMLTSACIIKCQECRGVAAAQDQHLLPQNIWSLHQPLSLLSK